MQKHWVFMTLVSQFCILVYSVHLIVKILGPFCQKGSHARIWMFATFKPSCLLFRRKETFEKFKYFGEILA